MKVAWVIPGIPAGGVSTVCVAAAQALARQTSHEVSLIAAHWCHVASSPPAGIKLVSLELPVASPGALPGFHGWLQNNPHDILLMNDSSELEPYWPYVPTRTKLIVVVHDDGNRYVRSIIRFRHSLDAIVTVARHIERVLARKTRDYRGILTTVYNGCDYPEVIPRSFDPGHLSLLYVGNMDPLLKGITDIPRVLKYLSKLRIPVELTVAGGDDAELRRTFACLSTGGPVTWVGRISRDECFSLFSRHDILLVPSRREAFGMIVIEAMAMGCVPFAYDMPGGPQEIIQSGYNGQLVEFGDFRGFAAKMGELHKDRGKLERMSLAACESARMLFSSERMAADYSTLFENLATTPFSATRFPGPLPAFQGTAKGRYALLPGSWRRALRRFVGRRPALARIVGKFRN
jgi:glycosyltransferase involved in cell wall biosynthesis